MAVVLVANGPMRGIDLRESSLSVAKKFQLIVAVPDLTVKIQNQITIRLAGMENERVISFATRQHIRPGSPINPIVASQTIDGIAAGGANKIIIARSADNISRRWRRGRSNIIIGDGA